MLTYESSKKLNKNDLSKIDHIYFSLYIASVCTFCSVYTALFALETLLKD
ncbi:hypothetical protein [Spiroplasma endosymbiont of Aspidapion aeneum]